MKKPSNHRRGDHGPSSVNIVRVHEDDDEYEAQDADLHAGPNVYELSSSDSEAEDSGDDGPDAAGTKPRARTTLAPRGSATDLENFRDLLPVGYFNKDKDTSGGDGDAKESLSTRTSKKEAASTAATGADSKPHEGAERIERKARKRDAKQKSKRRIQAQSDRLDKSDAKPPTSLSASDAKTTSTTTPLPAASSPSSKWHLGFHVPKDVQQLFEVRSLCLFLSDLLP